MKKTDFKQMAQAYGTIIALLVIIMIFGVLKPAAFLTLKNFINISRQMAALTIISIGATMVMVVNEFDLSVGSMASLGGVMAALMAVAGIPVGAGFLLTVLVCMAIGWINGYIVAKFKVLSFITTLAVSYTHLASDHCLSPPVLTDQYHSCADGIPWGQLPHLLSANGNSAAFGGPVSIYALQKFCPSTAAQSEYPKNLPAVCLKAGTFDNPVFGCHVPYLQLHRPQTHGFIHCLCLPLFGHQGNQPLFIHVLCAHNT